MSATRTVRANPRGTPHANSRLADQRFASRERPGDFRPAAAHVPRDLRASRGHPVRDPHRAPVPPPSERFRSVPRRLLRFAVECRSPERTIGDRDPGQVRGRDLGAGTCTGRAGPAERGRTGRRRRPLARAAPYRSRRPSRARRRLRVGHGTPADASAPQYRTPRRSSRMSHATVNRPALIRPPSRWRAGNGGVARELV